MGMTKDSEAREMRFFLCVRGRVMGDVDEVWDLGMGHRQLKTNLTTTRLCVTGPGGLVIASDG